ncbi:hypothetical protein D9Q98_000601 [Chlorella vulgaris]|uniref:RING-type E3 ubiquitin transferase n=1 Tax=Chlorella vulgaris TaxID=3077 RepID=A0A9D4TZD8_CHLVU|nr:hypothetical protein D9Q98_000601 [Chlorella vulgaris]
MLTRLAQLWRGEQPGSARSVGGHQDEEDEDELPEDFCDPITLGCMQDPVLLCGTGQVYCSTSLRSWLATGSRTCPRTNLELRDVELVRLPSVRGRIAAWRAQHSLPQLPALDPPPDVVQAAGRGQEEGEGQGEAPPLASLLADLRSGDVYKRGVAAGRINNMLIEWGRQPHRAERAQVMEAMLLDLVWLLRQGNPYGSGVAAAALAQYDHPSCSTAFLAAVAACPAVALLWSPHSYGQHSAARLLAQLARATPSMPEVLVEAGAVRGLLQQLDLRVPFQYNRCSAAAALAALCKHAEGRQEVRRGGGIRLLKELVLQAEPASEPECGEHLIRFDKRDASTCLLALRLTADEVAQSPLIDLQQLRSYSHCSRAWLLGHVSAPATGYSAEEVTAGLQLRAAGEAEEDGWDTDEAEEEPQPGG